MFILTKISLIITFILTVAVTAQTMGKLNNVYTMYILMIGLTVQFIMVIIFITIILYRRNEMKKGIKIIRYKAEDRYIKGCTDIIPQYIAPTNPRKSSIFKIFVETENFKGIPDFGICKMGKGDVNIDLKQHILNIRTGIVAKSFIFDADIIMRPVEKINCKFKDDVNIKLFFVRELYIP